MKSFLMTPADPGNAEHQAYQTAVAEYTAFVYPKDPIAAALAASAMRKDLARKAETFAAAVAGYAPLDEPGPDEMVRLHEVYLYSLHVVAEAKKRLTLRDVFAGDPSVTFVNDLSRSRRGVLKGAASRMDRPSANPRATGGQGQEL